MYNEEYRYTAEEDNSLVRRLIYSTSIPKGDTEIDPTMEQEQHRSRLGVFIA